jgi:uncharacterized membrane protein YdjX (TVP38/TMEM64 family)
MRPESAGKKVNRPAWSPRRLWLLLPIALILILFFALDLQRFIGLAELREHQAEWRSFIEHNLPTAMLIFLGVYTAVVVLSIPGAAFGTLIGGFLFGATTAFPMVVVASTLGSTVLFLIARSALGTLLEAKAGPWFARLEEGFRRDEWSYMFFLRVTPLVPFFIVNLVPAFLGVDLLCFVVTTFFGIMPIAFIYCLAGAGIGDALQVGTFSIGAIFTPKVVLALTGLGALALVPALLHRFRKTAP